MTIIFFRCICIFRPPALLISSGDLVAKVGLVGGRVRQGWRRTEGLACLSCVRGEGRAKEGKGKEGERMEREGKERDLGM